MEGNQNRHQSISEIWTGKHMSYCINPTCKQRQNPDNQEVCLGCGNQLLIQDRYRLIKPLRELGLSHYLQIFEVDDGGKPKVLKVLTRNHHAKCAELFEQEAKILTTLQHPGIPQAEPNNIFSVQLNNGQQLRCLVMTKVMGQNLEQWLLENQILTQEALAIQWLQQLTEIIGYVHQQKFFHRDIKPSNIMLQPDGQLVLIDFGAVRQVTETVLQGGDVTAVLTHGYAAPEQYQRKAQPESDFFALGRTFVHLLTGKHPAHLLEDKKGRLIWRESAPHISQPLANVIDELMAPEVRNRPRNTKVIRKLLQEIELPDGSSPTIRWLPHSSHATTANTNDQIITRLSNTSVPFYRRWRLIIGFAALSLAGIAWMGWSIAAQLSNNTVSQPCNRTSEDVSAIDFSPNGKYIATASFDNTVRVLQVKQGNNNKQVGCQLHKEGVVAVKFSPDGKKIATASLDATAGLGDINPKDGSISNFQFLPHTNPAKPVVALDFSKDGKYLATANADGMVKITDSSTGKEIASLKFKNYVKNVTFSPGGKYLAIASLNNQALVWEWETHTNEQKIISLPQNDLVAIAFHPTSGEYLATVSADGKAQVWDISTRQPVAVLKHQTYLTGVSFSPDGTHLVLTSLKNDVLVWNWEFYRQGKNVISLPQDDEVVATAFSPKHGMYLTLAIATADGRTKVWTNENGDVKTWQDNHNLVALRFSPGNDSYLATVSTDGKVQIRKWK